MKQEHITIKTSDNQTLDAVILLHPDFPPKRPAILALHGWTSSKERYIERVTPLVQMGYICLLFDMRGHGKSDGELQNFSRKDHLEDCLAAYDFLANDSRVDADDISLFGSSYGGYMASVVVGKRSVAHLALKAPAQYPDDSFEVPTLSIREFMLENYFHKSVKVSENKAFAALNKFQGDVLLLQCEKDEIIPPVTIQNYLNALKINTDHFILKGSDHSSRNPNHNRDFISALSDWFQALREERIIEAFRAQHPYKATVEIPSLFPTEFLCEVESTSEHPEYSKALVVIDKSAPHKHLKTTETYKVLKGSLLLHKDDTKILLGEGDELTINPGEIHWAEGHETLIECYSRPGWTREDHVLEESETVDTNE
ncbi:MAG: alpha/beta fold hydrolase [bacterium]|nr:alpha/beta fold hydrolase [bacterium]